jgi:segregation and condensation protein B
MAGMTPDELEVATNAAERSDPRAEPQRREPASGSSPELGTGSGAGSGQRSQEDPQDATGAETAGAAQDGAALSRRVEAALMVSDRPVTAARLGEAVGGANVKTIRAAVRVLNDFYDQSERSFRIEELAGGYQLVTLPAHREVVAAMTRSKAQTRLTGAALETLAIIAYKQPILRAQLEAIRGVACGEVLRSLMERRLVKIVGRSEEIGRPMLYGTTKAFLEWFGLAQLKDLPKIEDFARLRQAGETGATGAASPSGAAPEQTMERTTEPTSESASEPAAGTSPV